MGHSVSYLRKFDFSMMNDFIDVFDLHHSYPVPAAPLYEALNVMCWHNVALPKPDDCPAFSALHPRQGFGVAVFDPGLKGPKLTHSLFHELGHLMLHTWGKPRGCVSTQTGLIINGVVLKEELEADLVACYLAAPGQAVLELFQAGLMAAQVAATLNITPEMLQLRAEVMIARNEFGVRDKPFYINL